MMCMLNLSIAVELIALGVGIAFLVWAYQSSGAGTKLAKVFGYIIAILAVVLMVFTGYCGTMHWMKRGFGYGHGPGCGAGCMMKHHMMRKMMQPQQQQGPMMQQQQQPAANQQ